MATQKLMKRIFTLLFICCHFIGATQVATNGEALLNTQLGSFQSRFKILMNTRGFTWYRGRDKIELRQLQAALQEYSYGNDESPETYLLFYHHQQDTLYSWLLNKSGIVSADYSIVSPGELVDLEAKLKSSIQYESSTPLLAEDQRRGATGRNTDTTFKPFAFYSRQISSLIFPPKISGQLINVKSLIIVPELNISSLPLYALQPFTDDSYLVDRMSISLAHSLDEFLNRAAYYCRLMLSHNEPDPYTFTEAVERKKPVAFVPENPLVVGNPDYSKCSNLYRQLPGAEIEAKLVSDKLNTTPLLGKAATKEEVLKRMKSSEFIYLATHGHADVDSPLTKSHLVFAGDEKSCGFWKANEIQFDTVPYNALVILSACETGLGKVLDAGIIGLSRAFIKANAGNVVMSLWSVDDEATKELMDIFTDELFKPQYSFPAENLRQAILKFKQKDAKLSHWSAFVNMGTPYPPGLLVKLEASKR